MTNIPQPSNKRWFSKHDVGLSFGAVAFAWLVGWAFFDSWLTPPAVWLLWCTTASCLLALTAWVIRRVLWVGVCLLVLQLAAALVLPAASRSSKLTFLNDTEDHVEVVILDALRSREKRLWIAPHQDAEFIYFLGDNGHDIKATITVRGFTKGFSNQQDFVLTTREKMDPIRISRLRDQTEKSIH